MARRGGKNKTGRKPGGGKSRRIAKEQNADSVEPASLTTTSSSKKNPLIAFIGQLSFDTTRDDLMDHIRTQLKDTRHKVSDQTIKIRMLTDPKTKTFRGMAFIEVHDDPEFLYALLKLHQTYLKGRRINVERSAGGRKNSESRKSKLDHFKKEQEEYFAKVVDNILQEFQTTGEIRKDELDEGVLTLCRRHAGPVVKAAITEYVEKGGRDMDNPSAYLTFLVAKFAKEGIHDVEATSKTKKTKRDGNKPIEFSNRKRKGDHSGDDEKNKKRSKETWEKSSRLVNSGVDMSMSINKDGKSNGIMSTKDLSKIFPSSQRGKGRGYMRNVR
ncbi:RNA recognition motif containing protein [Nitzschia inconspicua]|uniref:RNA recognition motif containing protein n=1 Tax=Nitzschia inconspicua TaxID=303405 RepID=A0A9K3PJW7_9STRA|nr:RNA recognition motif containing protein [Nitzschia inconspicua]